MALVQRTARNDAMDAPVSLPGKSSDTRKVAHRFQFGTWHPVDDDGLLLNSAIASTEALGLSGGGWRTSTCFNPFPLLPRKLLGKCHQMIAPPSITRQTYPP